MKRIILLISLAVFLAAACTMTGLLPGEEAVIQESENRCGDGVCDGPENIDRCPEDCTDSVSGRAPGGEAVWLNGSLECEDVRESSVLSEGSPWAFDADGNTTQLLPDGQVTCVLRIQVCGDSIFKQQVTEEGGECPASLHYSAAPPVDVCCDDWEAAKQGGSSCDPIQDADCDGLDNNSDDFPLDPGR